MANRDPSSLADGRKNPARKKNDRRKSETAATAVNAQTTLDGMRPDRLPLRPEMAAAPDRGDVAIQEFRQ